MICLGIDTSGETLSVGLSSEGEILGDRIYRGERFHSEMIIGEIDALLRDKGIGFKEVSLIAASAGPGRYTALRVGMATAKGLALARGVPLVRVSALEALAYGLLPCEGPVCTLLDARRRLVYYARFNAVEEQMQRVEEDQALSYQSASDAIPGGALLTGDGIHLIQPLLEDKGVTFFTRHSMIHGGNVAKLGEAAFDKTRRDELYEGPTYIREVEIHNKVPMTTPNR